MIGEVGLTGELRAVTMAEKRVVEARKMGFTQCILPQANVKGIQPQDGIRLYGAAHIGELLGLLI